MFSGITLEQSGTTNASENEKWSTKRGQVLLSELETGIEARNKLNRTKNVNKQHNEQTKYI